MHISHWYGPPYIYCASYYKDAWDVGLTHSYREYWF